MSKPPGALEEEVTTLLPFPTTVLIPLPSQHSLPHPHLQEVEPPEGILAGPAAKIEANCHDGQATRGWGRWSRWAAGAGMHGEFKAGNTGTWAEEATQVSRPDLSIKQGMSPHTKLQHGHHVSSRALGPQHTPESSARYQCHRELRGCDATTAQM